MINWLVKNRKNLLETIIFSLCIGLFVWSFICLVYLEDLPK